MLESVSASRYAIDPRDPRAPAQAVWDALSEDERLAVVKALPSEFPSASPPEGDAHRLSKTRALETLEQHFRRIRRRIQPRRGVWPSYLSAELPVYYPDEPMFAPDLLAVRDVESHERQSWVVSHEKRGIDFVLEIHVAGDARKDYALNVERYARLGIPEYFAFNPVRPRLMGWRLSETGTYTPIVPQEGRWPSAVLELDLNLFQGRLRFLHGHAPLPDARELIGQLSQMVDDAVRRAEEESKRAEEESKRAERLAARLRELGIDPDAD